MRYIKMLGLLAFAATALIAFAGTASATVTSPPGTAYGAEGIATSTNFQLDGTIKITCKHSELRGTPTTTGSTTITIGTLTFAECNRTVTATALGTLSIESNGTVKSSGARITVQTTILGFPVHCIYVTNNSTLGTLTEGVAPAVVHIGAAPIAQEATSGACGNDAVLTGTFTATKPTSAIVVD